ncbi:MAG TPA: helix-turn-helix domain-containing protein [Anaerolineae bacterium]|nr:helix-turn-helix domain-containing protein [Anaerolineae bacterium]
MSEVVAKGWITVEEAQVLAGYSVAYLRRLARRGRIEAQKVGGDLWLIHRDGLLAYRSEMDALGTGKHDPRRGRGSG